MPETIEDMGLQKPCRGSTPVPDRIDEARKDPDGRRLVLPPGQVCAYLGRIMGPTVA
jgi:hypothetical protein